MGGGIVGVVTGLLAHERNPGRKILLLERNRIGEGATGLCAGLATRVSRSARHREISERSASFYDRLAGDLPGFHRLPLLFVCSPGRREELLASVHGPPPERGGPEDRRIVEDICGPLPHGLEVLRGGTAVYGEVPALVAELAARLRQSGADLREGLEVRGIEARGDALEISTAGDARFRARGIVVATGPWMLSGPGRDLAQRSGVRIKKIVSLHIDRRPPPGSPVVYFFDDGAFLLPLAKEGIWLFSFRCDEWDCPPDRSVLRITDEDRGAGLAVLRRHAPGLAEQVRGGRVFCDAYTPDGAPLIESDPALPGLVVAGAGSGSGFRLAPGIAARALDLLDGIDGIA